MTINKKEDFISRAFHEDLLRVSGVETRMEDIGARILRGGYPEPIGRADMRRKSAWFDAYITTLLERDVRDLSQVQDLTALPRLVQLLATRSASLFNQSEVSRSSGIPNSTLGRYLNLLQAIFLIQTLPAWSGNLGKRLVKAPKLFFVDTGIACHLLGIDNASALRNQNLAGNLLENFVACEIIKQLSWTRHRARPYHFRSHTGQEVDLILEDASGRMVGIEVKFSSTVSSKHFKGLQNLKESVGGRFLKGVVLYTGTNAVPFGEDLLALPVSGLWSPCEEA